MASHWAAISVLLHSQYCHKSKNTIKSICHNIVTATNQKFRRLTVEKREILEACKWLNNSDLRLSRGEFRPPKKHLHQVSSKSDKNCGFVDRPSFFILSRFYPPWFSSKNIHCQRLLSLKRMGKVGLKF